MLCGRNFGAGDGGSVPVYLNVYDLTPINGYAYWLGLGVYHSGVQVHGVEYAFGAHEYPTTGIFEAEPKHCEGFTFRKTILIGKTDMSPAEVRAMMEKLSAEYRGNAYNLITKNCNHFCNAACVQLTGNPIPRWVNRLARIGFLCNCVLPANIYSTKVRHRRIAEKHGEGERKKVRSQSKINNCGSSASSSPVETSTATATATATSSPCMRRGRSRTRRSLPPSSPLILNSSSS